MTLSKNEDRKYAVCITIPLSIDEILIKVGNGNRSEGVRMLAQQYADSHDLNKPKEEVWQGILPDGHLKTMNREQYEIWLAEDPEARREEREHYERYRATHPDDDQFAEWDC